MTKIKLCGMKRACDISCVNELLPDYIGFVFVPGSKRYVTFDEAEKLRGQLSSKITPVGVFAGEEIKTIEYLFNKGIISVIQLHGSEDNEYIRLLRRKLSCPVIQAFHIENENDIKKAEQSEADYIMLDSGGGTGKSFDHSLVKGIRRDFFLAGGLSSENVCAAISAYHPYAVDASSSLETNGVKDKVKMTAFINAVRNQL